MKRVFKLLPTLILTILLTGVAVAFFAIVFMNNSDTQEERKKFQIAIVGNIEESYLGFGIYALQSIDDSHFMIDFLDMTEQEAQSALRQGKLTSYVRVPEGFVDSIVNGYNDCPITYVPSEGQKGIGAMVMDEVADIASSLVTSSQSAIYGMQSILFAYGKEDILLEATDKMNLSFIAQVLNRTDFCDIEILGIANGVSTEGYYFCGILLLLMLLFGINSSPWFTKRSIELSRVLSSKGIDGVKQVAGEYLAYVSLTLIYMIILFILSSLVLGGDYLRISEWSKQPVELLWSFFVKLLPVVILVTAMHFMLYELVTGVVSGILLQFICMIGMGYLSGVFYPASFFPQTMQRIGEVLPTGLALRYMNEAITENNSFIIAAGIIIYSIVFLGISMYIRNNRIQRG